MDATRIASVWPLRLTALVHGGRAVWALWKRAADKIQLAVVTTLFSVSYLVLVPPLWLVARARNSLRLRDLGESTWWVERREEERTAESFQRMG